MTTVKDVLIHDALENHKKYKEEKKKEKELNKVQVKIQKSRDKNKVSPLAKVWKQRKSVSKGINTRKVKKVNQTTLKKKKRKELLLRAKKVVYARDKDICQHCDKKCIWSDRHASHVIPVSATGRLALYPLNMKVLCYHCHLNWWHKNPIEAGRWFVSKFPERLKQLEKLSSEIWMWSITLTELEEIERIIEQEEKLLHIIS